MQLPMLLLGLISYRLQGTSAFVTLPRAGKLSGTISSAGVRDIVSLSAEGLESNHIGTADVRLAGWRASPPPGSTTCEAIGEISEWHVRNGGSQPTCGDVVEYPLSEQARRDADDGRDKGVAVIMSINKERNDAWKLPEDVLDRAELQVLCPDLDAREENIWMTDELESCAFAEISEMRALKSRFNGALDKWQRWLIEDELSEGCGARDAQWEYDVL